MPTNLRGRLRNTPLPYTSALLPLFEAVVNSIHATEEASLSMEDARISVEILRKPKQESLALDSKKKGPEAQEDIVGFKITDNGIGFNDQNMLSFRTLDTDHKVKKGGRGIGRLLWLKAFKRVKVQSTFFIDGVNLKERSFDFTDSQGVISEECTDAAVSTPLSTTVHLDDFSSKYRSYVPKKTRSIADSIFEHCLWYFIREGGAPSITIFDEDERFSLDEIFEQHMHTAAIPEQINIKGEIFELTHVKLRSKSQTTHSISFCADNRLVCEEKLSGKIPGLYGRINDGDSDFTYTCYISSAYLNEAVRPERTGFEIPDTSTDRMDQLFEDSVITLADIRGAVIEKISLHLHKYLNENIQRSKERIERFVATKSPRYRPILSRISDEQLNVDPDISDRDLNLTLYKHFTTLENELIEQGHDIMSASPDDNFEDYTSKLQDYLAKAADIKKSDLAGYVSHRRVIIDLLEKAIQKTPNGKYAREEIIHKLIIPMQMDSNSIPVNGENLWLIDERLAFHDYLASDRPLSSYPTTGSVDKKEPDICCFNVFDQPLLVAEGTKLPPASIEVIEIKRPMRNDAKAGEDHDPIEQVLGYLKRIRAGGVETTTGRPIPSSPDIPGFCFVLADLTDKLIERCELMGLTRTSDGQGYFGYNPNLKAYIEIISFDRLLQMAKERNRAFFDRLGLPSN